MRKFIKYIIFIPLIILLHSCAEDDFDYSESLILNPEEMDIVTSINHLGCEITKQSYWLDGNTLFSPLCTQQTLACLYNSAESETKDDLAAFMHLTVTDQDQLNNNFKRLLEKYELTNQEAGISLYNKLITSNQHPIRETFINISEYFYDIEMEYMDYTNQSSLDSINTWIKNSSNNNIDKGFEELPEDDNIILLNGINMQIEWNYAFSDATDHKVFYMNRADSTELKFMSARNAFRSYETSYYHYIELPLKNKNYSMVLVIPKSIEGIDETMNSFTVKNLENCRSEATEKDITLVLPNTKIALFNDMRNHLQEAEMNLFSSDANFTGISEDQLYVSEYRTFSSFSLNKKGALLPDSYQNKESENDKLIIANKPFIICLRENTTNCMFLSGIFKNPNNLKN